MSSTIDIRKQLGDEKQRLISTIWAYFVQNNGWMPVRGLHKEFGGKVEARALIEQLGGSVVFIPDQTTPQQYTLTTLGVLLSDQGERYERLLADYLKFVQEKAYDEPSRTTIKSQEVGDALNLKLSEVMALGKLLQQ